MAGGSHAKPIAQWVMLFMLAAAKNLPRLTEFRQTKAWEFLPADELTGRTCGIIGLGSIGHEVARLARAFEMVTIGLRRTPRPSPLLDEVVGLEDLDSLLARSDYVVICAPLNAQSHRLVGPREFALMKESSWLLNVGRGAIVDESALAEALRDGVIKGAALDVFEKEPLPADSPLWAMPNVYITPHNSGSSPFALDRAVEVFARNLECFARGEPMPNEVDPAETYATSA